MNALIVFVALALPQQQAGQSLYSRIVQNPTGQNGYEEYLMAADRALAVDLQAAVKAINIKDGESTRLSRVKNVVDKSNYIARLIEAGNRKPAFYPGPLNFKTLLPELQTFRTIAKAMAARAEWQFSQGRPNAAVDTTIQILAFADSVAGAGPAIHYAVSNGSKYVALAVLSKHRARIALPGAQALDQFAKQSLDRQSPMLRALHIEFKAVIESLDSIVDDRRIEIGFREGPNRRPYLRGDLESMSDAQLKLLKSEMTFALTKHYEARSEMLERPEVEWEELSRRLETIAVPTDPDAQALVHIIQNMFSWIDQMEIVRRAQLRLLILHAAIIEYRWTHGQWTYGQLPSSLSVLDVPISIIDPLTGEPFKYELTDDEYDLYSEGTPGTGRIDLNWRSNTSNNELMPPSMTMLRRASSSTTSSVGVRSASNFGVSDHAPNDSDDPLTEEKKP